MGWNDFSLRDFFAESPKERKGSQLLLSTFWVVFAYYFQKQLQGTQETLEDQGNSNSCMTTTFTKTKMFLTKHNFDSNSSLKVVKQKTPAGLTP